MIPISVYITEKHFDWRTCGIAGLFKKDMFCLEHVFFALTKSIIGLVVNNHLIIVF